MIKVIPTVEKVVLISHPFKLVSREYQKENTIINVGNIRVGDNKVVIIAGPCAVEGKDIFLQAAQIVKNAQVGTRNMQNFKLLKELGQIDKPVLLKRGMSATIEEWLMAAEYIVSEGNGKVILCERGIRTFETYTRNTLDLSAVPIIKALSHLPVFVDPSHSTGSWKWVAPMSMAAIAAGADGLLVEVHPSPQEALSDGPQSLNPEHFSQMVAALEGVAKSVDRSL